MEAGPSRCRDARHLRREFEAIKDGTRRFHDPDEVLGTFDDAFTHLFGAAVVPTSLATTSTTGKRLDASDIILIETVQSSLLLRIVVDLATALPTHRLQDLLCGWFFGPTLATAQRGTVQQCALRTVSRHLSSPGLHPLTLTQLEQLLSLFAQWSLPSLIAAVEGEANRARADVSWGETLRLVTAIPDRLANATQGRMPQGFEQSWFENVLVGGLAECLAGGGEMGRVREVLLRLERAGWLSRAVDSEGRGFWGTLLRRMQEREGVARGWTKIRARLGRELRRKLDAGLVETLLYWMTKRGLPTGLVAASERGRAGTEGSAFLGKDSQEAVAATSLLFDTLLCAPAPSSSSPSDSDTDDEDSSSIIDTFTTLSLIPHQSPLLAWAYTTHLSSHLSASSLLNCLESTISHWSLPHRISRTLVSTELFLTTLITALLASLPATTPGLAAVVRSQRVIEGVSAHLDASDPAVRRLGMLVAELLSAKTAAEGGKVLNFGSGVWNGTGEGREEVRVLRALSDAWEHHRTLVDAARERLSGRPLGEVIDVIGITTQSGVVKPEAEPRVAKRTGKGRTRRLPEKIDAPPRQKPGRRPLITMLGSDDEVEPPQQGVTSSPLKMFSSTHHGEPDASSASDSSSDDDSDSDTAPASDPHSVHRLAASLSGLSASEAGDLLNNPSSLPPPHQRSKEKVGDFDTNRESHAPQFHTKTPAPIYISQLSALLRSSTRASIRLALHHAAPLIRRKQSTRLFGGEVRENAVDLTLTLIALHDNFGIKGFEGMRREAVCELAIAQPKVVVEVLVEAGMGAVYSDTQRMGCWCGVVESAVVLARGRGEDGEGTQVGRRAEKAVEGVIRNAREVGEQSVPQMRRQKQLSVHPSSTQRGSVLVQPHHPSTSLDASSKDTWEAMAASTYIFPLIHRFLAYRTHHISSTTRGTGTSSLFTPTTLSLFFDTLTVLLSLCSSHTITAVTPSVLELLCASVDPGLSPTSPVVASLTTLLAVTLDRVLQADAAAVLEDGECVRRLQGLLGWSKGVFAELHGATGEGKEGKVAARAASVLLLMARLDEVRAERMRRLIGFVPA